MSDHAAVTEEHRKLATQVTDLLGLPAMVGNRLPLLQLLADFERDARVKEAETINQAYYDCATEDGMLSFDSWILSRIEQLKRGQI